MLNVVKPKFNGNFARTKKFFRYENLLNKKGIFTLRSFNRSSRREKVMASNPLFIIPDFFFAFSKRT